MCASIKNIFSFMYQTDLDTETCYKRFENGYTNELANRGVRCLYYHKNWQLSQRRTKKGVVKISLTQPRLEFIFKARLLDEGNKTVIACSHNPFLSFMNLMVTIILLCGLLALGLGLMSPDKTLVGYWIVIFAPLTGVFAYKIYTARRIFDDYLEKVLETEPITYRKKTKGDGPIG